MGEKTMTNNKISLVIFDMDGTIFDTERLGLQCWVEAFKTMNIPVPEKALFNKIGLNSKDSKKLMKEESGIDFDYDEVKKVKRIIIKKHIAQQGTPIKEGFGELVQYLKQHNIKMALATSRSREMTDYYMQNAGQNFANQFDCFITGDMIEKGKPNPDIFLHAASQLGISPQNSLVVEDSPNGIKAAYAANMKSIMIPDLVEPTDDIKQMAYTVKKNLKDVISVVSKINYQNGNFSRTILER